MSSEAQKNSTPSLDALINAINLHLDQMPHPYAADGFVALRRSLAEELDKQGRQYIRFLLDGTVFALPLQRAIEIDYVPEITPLPNLPLWVLGICNLRGEIVSIVDLKHILHLSSAPTDTAGKLIVIGDQEVTTAIIVDKVIGILLADSTDSIDGKDNQNVEAPSANKAIAKFIQGVIEFDKQIVHFLDVDALLESIAL